MPKLLKIKIYNGYQKELSKGSFNNILMENSRIQGQSEKSIDENHYTLHHTGDSASSVESGVCCEL